MAQTYTLDWLISNRRTTRDPDPNRRTTWFPGPNPNRNPNRPTRRGII